MKHQRGFSLNQMMVGGIIFFIVALLAMKVLPEWIEYGKVVKTIKATAQDTTLKDGSVAQVRAAWTKRAELDEIHSITAQDLDITKDGNELVIAFEYSRKVPLFSNVSLVFDFEGSSAKQ